MTKRSQFSVVDAVVNDKKGHNIVNDSFAHKPDGLLVVQDLRRNEERQRTAGRGAASPLHRRAYIGKSTRRFE